MSKPPAAAKKPRAQRYRPPRAAPPPPPFPPPTPSGRPATSIEAAARVAYVADRIDDTSWSRELAKAMAAHLDVDPRTIRYYAQKAAGAQQSDTGGRVAAKAAALARLRKDAETARKKGKIGDAIRAETVLLRYLGDPGGEGSSRRASPEGLPPELARLRDPRATPEELSHFAAVSEEDCTLAGCRSHPRGEAAAEGALPAAGGLPGAPGTPPAPSDDRLH